MSINLFLPNDISVEDKVVKFFKDDDMKQELDIIKTYNIQFKQDEFKEDDSKLTKYSNCKLKLFIGNREKDINQLQNEFRKLESSISNVFIGKYNSSKRYYECIYNPIFIHALIPNKIKEDIYKIDTKYCSSLSNYIMLKNKGIKKSLIEYGETQEELQNSSQKKWNEFNDRNILSSLKKYYQQVNPDFKYGSTSLSLHDSIETMINVYKYHLHKDWKSELYSSVEKQSKVKNSNISLSNFISQLPSSEAPEAEASEPPEALEAPAGQEVESEEEPEPEAPEPAGQAVESEEELAPEAAKPAAKVTACCSAIPTSKVRSGNFFSNKFNPVPEGIAPVIPIILVSCSACLIKVSAKTFVYEGALD